MLDTSFESSMSITSMVLPAPMTAGELYSLSAKYTSRNYSGTIEFWGTTSECGPGFQQLYSAPWRHAPTAPT